MHSYLNAKTVTMAQACGGTLRQPTARSQLYGRCVIF
jgi:F0F1-type ATP synthase membrane subunit c/vacuolar-type H+-ATPase subunit K